MPHAYVIIFSMTIITAILANIVPAGVFDRITDADGNEIVVAGSYHAVEKIGCSIFDMFKSIQLGFITLMIAESRPEEKETMVSLVMNFLSK